MGPICASGTVPRESNHIFASSWTAVHKGAQVTLDYSARIDHYISNLTPRPVNLLLISKSLRSMYEQPSPSALSAVSPRRRGGPVAVVRAL